MPKQKNEDEQQEQPLDLSLNSNNNQRCPSDMTPNSAEFAAFFELYTQFMHENFINMMTQAMGTNYTNDSVSPETSQSTNESGGQTIDIEEIDEGREGPGDRIDNDNDNDEEEYGASPMKKFRLDSICDNKNSKNKTIRTKKDGTTSKRFEANARERNRVQQLSKMFDKLRLCLPVQDDVKISKLSTLKVASAYIGFLGSLVDENTKEETKYKESLITELESAKTLRK